MNDEHKDDNLLISRAFGDPDAVHARMTTLDDRGGTWVYTLDGAQHEVTVPWRDRVAERPELRREIVHLYDLACLKLGIQPRQH